MTRRRQRATCLFRANTYSRVIRASKLQASASGSPQIARPRALPRSIGQGALWMVGGARTGSGAGEVTRRSIRAYCSLDPSKHFARGAAWCSELQRGG
ncbi:hypothetical protein HYPSUDRAFT_228289 [Hypholoma sublateritium FD-334 SS-4]|uniref:Uncharacterized protein n=1 Tax=Hypholoma sublateritium (strain FD-334 SS-4) TaxID=945553 RepID=A0A0D2LNP5_HYPSF|nr:hypothetical protein HYPSUDRAFT_228289 [Hypholoma sublateritium FD-334 SS-4]